MKALIVACLLAASAVSAQSEPITFRDAQWGGSPDLIEGLSPIEGTDGLDCFVRNGEKLAVGDATLQRIRYCFYRDKLGYVLVNYERHNNFLVLKGVLEQKFGQPYRPNQFIDSYWWGFGEEVAVRMEYSEITDTGTLIYRYKPVVDLQAKDQESSNARAAGDL